MAPSVTPSASPSATVTPTPLLVGTLAGDGTAGILDGLGAASRFDTPTGIVSLDTNPDVRLAVADTGNHRIRRVSKGGLVETLAGSGATSPTDNAVDPRQAGFNRPEGLAVDPNVAIYVADTGNHRIRRIAYTGGAAGAVTTIAGAEAGFADGAGAAARFSSPRGLAIDTMGKKLYVADSGNRRVRVVNLADNTFPVTTLAGRAEAGSTDGAGNLATFFDPVALAWDGAAVLVIDRVDCRIRRISPGAGTAETAQVSPYIGTIDPGLVDGGQGAARFDFRVAGGGLCIGPTMNFIIADGGNQRIRIHTDTLGTLTAAGTGGRTDTNVANTAVVGGFRNGPATAGDAATLAQFNRPVGVVHVVEAGGASGTIYVTDSGNHRIRTVQVGKLRDPGGSSGGPGTLPSALRRLPGARPWW